MAKKDKNLTKKSGGNKKKGRNLKKCAQYRLYNTRERNRDRRVARIERSLERARAKRRVVPDVPLGTVVSSGHDLGVQVQSSGSSATAALPTGPRHGP